MSEDKNKQTQDPVEPGTDGKKEKTFTRAQLAAAAKEQAEKAVEDFKKSSLPDLIQQAVDKTKRDATLSAQERAEESIKEREQKVAAKAAALDKRDALTATKALLADKGLPTKFADLLADTDSAKREANVETFMNTFNDEVQKKTLNKAKGGKTPGAGEGPKPKMTVTKKFKDMTYDERTALFREDKDKYFQLKQEG